MLLKKKIKNSEILKHATAHYLHQTKTHFFNRSSPISIMKEKKSNFCSDNKISLTEEKGNTLSSLLLLLSEKMFRSCL
jgi:hypothetical protein